MVDAATLDALSTMRVYQDSRAFFAAVTHAAARLEDIERELKEGPDSMPHGGGSVRGGGIGNPTESRAIWLVTEGAAWERRLVDERERLTYMVGCALVLVAYVRDGLGEAYADVLDARYVDDAEWHEVAERVGYSERHVKRVGYVALDWLDMKANYHTTI